jgi:polyferredoxin
MQRHRRVILAVQWSIVLIYAALVAVPAFLPLPPAGATILSSLTLFAQFAFWGIWWPFVIASMFLIGRMWCGVFCPEGALTEFASRHGLGRAIPHWMRWSGWPFVAFACTTLYGQLTASINIQGHAVDLGGSTVALSASDLPMGNSRLWCRYPARWAACSRCWRSHAARPASTARRGPLARLTRIDARR